MRLTFKIRLGNYEMMEVESSDHPTARDCMVEIYDLLTKLNHPEIDRFRNSSLFRSFGLGDQENKGSGDGSVNDGIPF